MCTVLGVLFAAIQRFYAFLKLLFERKKKEWAGLREEKRKVKEEKECLELVRKRGVVSVEAVT